MNSFKLLFRQTLRQSVGILAILVCGLFALQPWTAASASEPTIAQSVMLDAESPQVEPNADEQKPSTLPSASQTGTHSTQIKSFVTARDSDVVALNLPPPLRPPRAL